MPRAKNKWMFLVESWFSVGELSLTSNLRAGTQKKQWASRGKFLPEILECLNTTGMQKENWHGFSWQLEINPARRGCYPFLPLICRRAAALVPPHCFLFSASYTRGKYKLYTSKSMCWCVGIKSSPQSSQRRVWSLNRACVTVTHIQTKWK